MSEIHVTMTLFFIQVMNVSFSWELMDDTYRTIIDVSCREGIFILRCTINFYQLIFLHLSYQLPFSILSIIKLTPKLMYFLWNAEVKIAVLSSVEISTPNDEKINLNHQFDALVQTVMSPVPMANLLVYCVDWLFGVC